MLNGFLVKPKKALYMFTVRRGAALESYHAQCKAATQLEIHGTWGYDWDNEFRRT